MKKIVIVGTHLTPALAQIDQFKNQKDFKIIFFGRKFATEGSKNVSAEYKTIKNLGIQFYEITAGRFQRKFTIYTIPALLKIPIGFFQSLYYLIKVSPNIIVAFGGYLSPPVVFAGWLLGIKSITHEQSVKLGFANKFNSMLSEKTYLSWPQTAKGLANEKYQVVGNLTRQSIFNKKAKDAKIQEFIKMDKKLIFITGGNQGSHFINTLTFETLPNLSIYQVLHQAGTTNHRGDLDKALEIKQKNYLAVDYLDSENIGAVLNRADLIISRSGANTVWDLAVLAKVSILIPLPISASGEQEANAKILEKAGSAIIVDQDDLTPAFLKQKIDYILKNLPKFQKNAQTFAKTLPKNATQILSSKILKLIED